MTCLKDIFGEPNKGIHSIRVFDIAIVDVLLTILLAYILKTKTEYFSNDSIFIISCILVLSSIAIHIVLGVETKLTRLTKLALGI